MKTFTILSLICALAIHHLSAQTSPTNPYTTVEAEDYDAQQGTQLGESGRAVGYLEDGDWIRFDSLDFGNQGAASIAVHASSNTDGGTIEIRLESPTGDLVGTVDVSSTGGWSEFEYFRANHTAGFIYNRVTLYLVFKGDSGFLLDLDEFRFSTDVIATGLRFAECPTEIQLGSVYDFDVLLTPRNTTNTFVAFGASGGDIEYVDGEYTATELGIQTVRATSFSIGSVRAECTFTVVDSAGTAATEAARSVAVESNSPVAYPNPGTQGIFRLKAPLPAGTELTVTDLSGKVVLQQTASAHPVLDLSDQPNGMYLLRTAHGKTVKLVKE